MKFEKIYYEPDTLNYKLGKVLQTKYSKSQWIPIDNHNNIEELRKNPNTEFVNMKKLLIIGTRKTHVYRKNNKTSDFLVPYTSSGCTAMCLYCYLVCHYNKCAYLRLFVNREYMMSKLVKTAKSVDKELTFEIGSNSDLIVENTITSNLNWTIEEFGKHEKGFITLPSKFSTINSLLPLNHRGRTIIRISVNPQQIISSIEIGTSNLKARIQAINQLCQAGYKVGILIAPVIFLDNWRKLYTDLLNIIEADLSKKVKSEMFIEIIFMTYSFVHKAINNEAFADNVELYDKNLMTGRGMGKYTYNNATRSEGEAFFRCEAGKRFGEQKIAYII